MAAASDWFRTQILNQWFRGQVVTEPTTLYLAWHKADPLADGSGLEVTGGAYARAAITSNTTNWGAPGALGTAYAITNLTDITFPAPTADWGIITHWGLWDAATLGNLVLYGAVSVPREVLNGDIAPVVPASQFTVSID